MLKRGGRVTGTGEARLVHIASRYNEILQLKLMFI